MAADGVAFEAADCAKASPPAKPATAMMAKAAGRIRRIIRCPFVGKVAPEL
jgi:hypothetical protein